MDGFETTDTQLDKHTAQQEAGAAGESGKAGKLKPWKCPDCTAEYRLEDKPDGGHWTRCHMCKRRHWEKDCGPIIAHGMWPIPSETIPHEGKIS